MHWQHVHFSTLALALASQAPTPVMALQGLIARSALRTAASFCSGPWRLYAKPGAAGDQRTAALPCIFPPTPVMALQGLIARSALRTAASFCSGPWPLCAKPGAAGDQRTAALPCVFRACEARARQRGP